MKEKILAALKTKYQNLGFTDKALDGVAAFLAVSTIEEGQVGTAVDGAESLLKAFQGDADSRVNKLKTENEELKTKLSGVELPKPDDDKKPDDQKSATDIKLDKALEGIAILTGEITKLKGANTEGSRQSAFEALIKDADPEYKKMAQNNFELLKNADEETFSKFVTSTTEGISQFTKYLNEKGLNNLPKPTTTTVVSNSGKSTDFGSSLKEAVDAKLAEKAGK